MRKNTYIPLLFFWLFTIVILVWFVHHWMQPDNQVRNSGGNELVLERESDGHYYVDGSINAYPLRFMVDTGASSVSIPEKMAQKIKLAAGHPANFNTAGGQVQGRLVRDNTVTIGNISVTRLVVAVLPDFRNDEDTVLLGQNFLRHVSLTQQNKQMIIRVLPQQSP